MTIAKKKKVMVVEDDRHINRLISYYLTKPFSVAQLMDIIKELAAVRDRDYSVKTRA